MKNFNPKEESANSYLAFKVGEEIFAAHVSNILNILELQKITAVPKSPPHLKGVMNLRGSVLPIIDTRIKFGLTDSGYNSDTCILVVELSDNSESIKLGAIVDSVTEVLELASDDILPPPIIGTNFDSAFLTGMVKKDNDFIMIINVDKVFADDEIIVMPELRAETQ